MTNPLDREDLLARVQACVDDRIGVETAILAPLGPDVLPLVDAIAELLRGGKRLRAGFLYWGYRASGAPGGPQIVTLATAMEFFQAAALLHDDVMDHSDVRRGRPTAHRAFATRHRSHGWSGESGDYGAAAAILAGNLCLGWTDALVASCGLPSDRLASARVEYDAMRTQLMGGQYLDVLLAVRGWADSSTAQRIAAAREVVRFKSAKYSVEQPLLIGLRAGGLPPSSYAGASAFGLAVGEAFQLRDDLLGVFGDPAKTGKPAGDDLREGKLTVLVAEALDADGPATAALLDRHLGRPDLSADELELLRAALTDCGAVDRVEARITALTEQAHELLSRIPDIDEEARAVLGDLVESATERAD